MRLSFIAFASVSLASSTVWAQGTPIRPAPPPPAPAAAPAPAPSQQGDASAGGTPISVAPAPAPAAGAPAGGPAIAVQPQPQAQPAPKRPPEGHLYDDGSGEPPFYEPFASERFTLPPPPPPPEPPPPPGLKLSLTGYSQTHIFTGMLSGMTTEIGVKVGPKSIVAELGYLPDPGEAAIGIQLFRYFGATLAEPKEGMKLSFLAPGMAIQVITNFDDDVIGVLEMSGPGLGLSACGAASPLPFLVQARVPNLGVWLPFEVAGASLGEVATPALVWGFTLEAGVLFF